MILKNQLMSPGSISIVMPAFNEEGNITGAVMDCLDHIPQSGRRLEVIVVDDCSTDDTLRIARELEMEHEPVRVLFNSRNLGLGGSLRRGFSEASGELIFYTDSDLPIYMEDLIHALPLMESCDFVSGFRLTRDEGPIRFMYSRVYNLLVRMLFGIRVPDVNFSFKLMHRRVLEAVCLRSRGSFIDAELLAETIKHGFTIRSLGVRYRSRIWGESTLASLSVIKGIMIELYHYKWGELSPHD